MDPAEYGNVNLKLGNIQLQDNFLSTLKDKDLRVLELQPGQDDFTFTPESLTEVYSVAVDATNVESVKVVYTDENGKQNTVRLFHKFSFYD